MDYPRTVQASIAWLGTEEACGLLFHRLLWQAVATATAPCQKLVHGDGPEPGQIEERE